jgi:Family of unknown function (DUF6600)/FecR protein
MKLPFRFQDIFCAVLGLSLFLAPVVKAQDTDTTRVVRLSRAEGQVLVSHPGSDAWDEALVNLPLQEGDALATQGGLAEIEFENGATAYLAENSVLELTQLGFAEGGRSTELSLTQGTATFYANLTSQDSFRVLTPNFDVTIPGRAEFRVDAFRDGAAVEVLLGRVAVSTAKGSVNLEKGQSVAVHGQNFQDLNNIARLPEQDAFDEWVSEQSEIIQSGTKNTLGYISSPNSYGLSDLSIYGSWVNLSGFGLSWRPFSVGLGWTPYVNGVWMLDPRLGWIWVSNEAWGWMPYHFGSWVQSPTLGWVWVPGDSAGLRHWEPSCVNWVNVGGRVGWVARSPLDRGGAPANQLTSVVTWRNRSAQNGNGGNEILAGKELQNAVPLKAPPREFSSRVAAPGPLRSGFSSAARRIPENLNDNGSIVFDRGTHTFINRDGSRMDNGRRAPVPPVALPPQPGTGNEVRRVTIPSTMPEQPPANRVLLPPPYPASQSSHRNIPVNAVSPNGTPPAAAVPPRQPTAQFGSRPASASGQLLGNPGNLSTPPAATPRPTASPAAPPPPPAPHTAPGQQFGSAARPAAPPSPPAPSHPRDPDQRR